MNIYQDNLPPFKPYMIGLLIFMGIFFFIVRGCIAEEINLDAIAFIESSNDSLAYNQTSEARGLYQITPVCLEEYNNYNRTDYTKADLFSEGINKEIAIWYITIRIPQMLRYFNKGLTPMSKGRILKLLDKTYNNSFYKNGLKGYNVKLYKIINFAIENNLKFYLQFKTLEDKCIKVYCEDLKEWV